MLQIQLYKGEFLTIGDNIKIHCSKAGITDSVTLGIEAPREVRILRTKHAEEELKALAEAGDANAQAALQRLNTARAERAAKQQERNIRAVKRKEKRLEKQNATVAS